MSRFDWPVLLRAGIKGAGLRPAEFWALTPAELVLIMGGGTGSAPLTRGRREELARAYPDTLGGTDEREREF